ncbi:MAG: zinc dependent phospholipase C family protein, partial [Bacillota bacterium]
MNTNSHIMIAELIYEHLQAEHAIHLEKKDFIKGNTIPDFSYYAIAHPHFMRFSLGYIQTEVDAITNTYLESAWIGSGYSFRLGIICHYYADFFCYAHSSGYRQVVVNHLKYEHLLYRYFLDNYASIAEMKHAFPGEPRESAEEINKKTRELHAEYAGGEPSYGKDLLYTLRACAGAIVSLVHCSLKQPAAEPSG